MISVGERKSASQLPSFLTNLPCRKRKHWLKCILGGKEIHDEMTHVLIWDILLLMALVEGEENNRNTMSANGPVRIQYQIKK